MTAHALESVTVTAAGHDDVAAIRGIDGLGQSTVRQLEADLDKPDRRCLVARAGGAVIGFAEVLVGAGEAHVLDIAVDPPWRRRGVATMLVEAARAVARQELGATATTLEVRASNAAARALYRRLGFREAGQRPGYYPDGGPDGGREDAVIMWDRVPSAS